MGYTVTVFLLIGLGEALHHFPGLAFLNAFGTEHFSVQLLLLVIGMVFCLAGTLLSYRLACRRFEKIDL